MIEDKEEYGKPTGINYFFLEAILDKYYPTERTVFRTAILSAMQEAYIQGLGDREEVESYFNRIALTIDLPHLKP